MDTQLHTPMYLFLANLFQLNTFYFPPLGPKIFVDLLLTLATIPYAFTLHPPQPLPVAPTSQLCPCSSPSRCLCPQGWQILSVAFGQSWPMTAMWPSETLFCTHGHVMESVPGLAGNIMTG